MEAFVEDSVKAFVEASVASVEAFVKATSVKVFAKASVEASEILFPGKLPSSTEAFMNFHAKNK